ncbi:MAG: response regulator [Candidatus Heimdallarchaeota archaeon]|nr:MAG: response regulator [Candidatus Heimdallarchaeota archaeon]
METVRVLLVDDETELLKATKIYLEKAKKNYQIVIQNSANDALKLLGKEPFDVIVSDFQMPNMDGLEFLEKVRELDKDISFIIFTGKGREEVVIKALNLGADYYLQKGGDVQSQFSELINLINKSVDKKKADIALRKSEEKFSKAFKFSLNAMVINRFKGSAFLDINENFTKLLHYTLEDVLEKNPDELSMWAKREDYLEYQRLLREEGQVVDFETLLITKDAQMIPVLISGALIDIEGELCVLSVARDITELTEALEALKENEQRYRLLFEGSPVALLNLNLFEVKKQLDELGKQGIESLREYFKTYPKILANFVNLISINEFNNAALQLIRADDENSIKDFFDHEFTLKNIELFSKIFEFLISGGTLFEEEFTIFDLKDEKLRILVRLVFAPGYEETWSKVFVTMLHLTS